MSKICDTQDNFNTAFENAVKYVEKKNKPKLWVQLVVIGIMIVLVVWALVLANKISGDQILHYILALAFSPIYIIAYYLGGMQ